MKNKILVLLYFLLVLPSVFSQEIERQLLSEDTPTTTVAGNSFTAPADWYLYQKGNATFLEATEDGSRLVIVDLEAENDSIAIAMAWAVYKPIDYPVLTRNTQPDSDGWTRATSVAYQVSPNEKRGVYAGTLFANGKWTVWIYDMSNAVGEKRGAQVNQALGSLVPKGYNKESFAGKKAHKLDANKLQELTSFIDSTMAVTKVPGVGLGIIQDGELVFAGGFGVRELGKDDPVDAETLFLVASNTKGLTTLLLAKLVEEGRFNWDTPVIELMPSFKLGSASTTSQTLVEHLICACTGLPRKDMEWIMEFEGQTASDLMTFLSETQPTSEFGELFQYSNSMAAAAGYMAGHVLYPGEELGAAYDNAMQTYVFDPLEMSSTTFDFSEALSRNHASAHGTDINGMPAILDMGINYSVIHVRPAGGAWSNITDMLKYVAMELKKGRKADGSTYIDAGPLLERRAAKVLIGEFDTYGMGLMVNNKYQVPVVHHGGDLFGHHSDMMWLPEHGVGAVVLTNGDPGWQIRNIFQRKLLEVLFDGIPEADIAAKTAGLNYFKNIAEERKLLTIPPKTPVINNLVDEYSNADLGSIRIIKQGDTLLFDMGEWSSEMASRENPDGTISLVSISPAMRGMEFVIGNSGTTPQLILRDSQHEYLFNGK